MGEIAGARRAAGAAAHERTIIPGGQHGLDMIVPPGFPNDTFPVLASSGERVKITPGAGGGGGSGRSVNIENLNVNVGAGGATRNPRILAGEVAAALGDMMRG